MVAGLLPNDEIRMTNDEESSNNLINPKCFAVSFGLRLPRRSRAEAGHSFDVRYSTFDIGHSRCTEDGI